MRVHIIGAGPGGEQWLTLEAHQQIRNADMVIATDRLYHALAHLNPHTVNTPLDHIPHTVRDATSCQNVVVLVSGDCGFYSLGKTLPALLREQTGNPDLEIDFVNGISSVQYLCALCGVSYDDARLLSLHGRKGDIVPYVSYNPKVFALTGGAVSPSDVIKQLVQAGLDNVTVFAGAHLGMPTQQLFSGTAASLARKSMPQPASLLILNPHSRNPHEQLADSAFIRGNTPMTKSAVRTLAVAALDIQPGERVIDIGAGTGSVSITMARKAFEGTVYALERNDEALELLNQNRLALGAFNMTIIKAQAPDGLEALPPLDKAFIGGSGGQLAAIMQALFAKNPHMRMVVTAITLESLHTAITEFQAHGHEPEITCINAAHAQAAGSSHMLKAENPVYIMAGGPACSPSREN